MSGEPLVDRGRRSVSIPRRLMPSLLAIHSGRVPAAAMLTELRAAGIMAATRLDPLVSSLVSVITNPTFVVTLEIDNARPAEKPELATIWRNGSTAVLGCRDHDGRFELIQIDPPLLPFHLAQAVRLVPRPQPAYAGSFRLPIATLTRIESMITTDPLRAEQEMTAAGIAAPWVDRMLATLIMRRSLWTVESVWLGDRRHREEARLSVLDGSFAGYWRLSHRDGYVTVTPTSFDELMNRFAALLPQI
ncbi:MAG: ESX secretion-associated protein EspG [Acidimicrobiia bacterium]